MKIKNISENKRKNQIGKTKIIAKIESKRIINAADINNILYVM